MIVAAPAFTPVTTPDRLTDAVSGSLVLHIPPVVLSVKLVVRPLQTSVIPEMIAGNGFTVIIAYTEQPVPPVV